MLTIKAHIRYFWHRPLQLALTLFGIALGVAVVTAVDLANTSARQAFKLSMVEVTGKTTHQLIGNNVTGIDQTRYRDFRFTFGKNSQIKSTPIIEGVVQINNQGFRLMGIDLISERNFRDIAVTGSAQSLGELLTTTNAVLMSKSDANNLNLRTGSTVSIRIANKSTQLKIAGLLESAIPAATQGLLVTDIASAQEIFNKSTYIDRIDLILPQNTPQVLLAVKSWLPQDMDLVNALAQSNSRLQTARAFQINLQAMSLMAILVGGFLIFNTLTFSILQRRKLIGILRGLGVTRQQIFTQIIVESMFMGLVGTTMGLAIGYVIGTGLVNLVVRTINDLYFAVAVSTLHVSALSIFKGFAIGLLISLIAALSPAWEAARTSPLTAQKRSTLEREVHGSMTLLVSVGFLLMFASSISFIIVENLIFAFAWLFIFVIGYCLSLAPFIVLLFKLLSPWLKRTGILFRLSIRSIPASISRTSVAIAALTVAVASTIGIGVMIDSFRFSVESWLQKSLSGDLYISAPSSGNTRIHGDMPVSIVNSLKAIEGIERVSHIRRVDIRSNIGTIALIAIKPPLEFNRRPPLYEGDPKTVWPQFDYGKQILISEPLARKHKLSVGNTLNLFTQKGSQPFLIGGLVQDYRSDQGMVFMHRNLYNRNWHDPNISGASVYLNKNADLATVKKAVWTVIQKYAGVLVRSNTEILESSMAIFERTFTITDVLRYLAIAVAFCGVFSALLAFQLERTKEIAILRATGLTRIQVWALVGIHTSIMGLLAGLFALPLGLILAWILINVINQIAFGWTMEMSISLNILLEGVALAVFAASLAAIYPAWRMAAISPARALREE